MKSLAEYTITPIGSRVIDRYRGDEIRGDVFKVTKFTPPADITQYEVMLSELGDTCTCPAGRRPDCKHRRMVRERDA